MAVMMALWTAACVLLLALPLATVILSPSITSFTVLLIPVESVLGDYFQTDGGEPGGKATGDFVCHGSKHSERRRNG